MSLLGPTDRLDAPVADEAAELAARAGHDVGHTPLGTPAWRRLAGAGDGNFVAAWSVGDEGKMTAFVQLVRSAADPTWVAEAVVDPAVQLSLPDLGAPLLRRTLELAAELGGGHVHLWAAGALPAHAELAARAGLEPHRALHQMRRPLPLDEGFELPLRAFRPGHDEDEVLEVNRLAFAHHPDQALMTRAMLEERMAQPWFDPAGFLLCELDGRVAGFCWTKLFAEERPVLGEIHVICVHPDFGGRGLGRGLVAAGLHHLHRVGAEVGMLFVEADNLAALDLYERLGFHIVRTDRAYALTLPSHSPAAAR